MTKWVLEEVPNVTAIHGDVFGDSSGGGDYYGPYYSGKKKENGHAWTRNEKDTGDWKCDNPQPMALPEKCP